MKRILFFSTILLIGGGTIGKNYLIYSQIQKLQRENSDRFQMDNLSWDWKQVQAKGVQVITKTEPHHTYLVQNITLTHDWLAPLQIQLKADGITGGNLQLNSIKGGFSYWSQIISSTDLTLQQVNIDMKRGHLQIPLIHAPFTYSLVNKKLDLDPSIPSSKEGTFKEMELAAKGSLVLSPLLNGKMDLQVNGISKLIAALVEHDIIKKKNAVYFELGAKLLGGGEDNAKVPLNFDQGNVYLGPILIYEYK